MIRYSEHSIGGEMLFQQACERSLEGIVSKRSDQPYRSGRSRKCLKIKCVHSQECVIIDFTNSARSRTGFGALLLGIYDDDKTLRYTGRVGTGFTCRTLDELRARLNKLRQSRTPLRQPPTGMSAKGWTEDGLLRHPSFQGLREDKPAQQIRRERTQAVAKTAGAVSSAARRVRRKSVEESMEIAGVKLSHPARVLYPEQGITKRDLAEYYAQIADWILPHMSGRPLTGLLLTP